MREPPSVVTKTASDKAHDEVLANHDFNLKFDYLLL